MSDQEAESPASKRPAAAVAPTSARKVESPEEEKPPPQKPVPFLEEVLINMDNLLDIISDIEHVPRNILLIGQPRAGKSAFINLIHACLRGRFETIAESGSSDSGENDTLSLHLRFFPNLGLSKKSMNDFRERYKDKLPENFFLPTIIDMPGIELEADIIEYILCGAVPPNTELHRFMTKQTISPFLDFENAASRRVDRVLFVASIVHDVQENLFQNVLKIVRGNEGTMPSIPYYLVFTHIDKASNPRSEKETDVMNTLLDILLLRGVSRLRVHEVTNYCDSDDIDKRRVNAYVTNLEKHMQGLSVLCKVLARREVIVPPNISAIPINWMTPYANYAKRQMIDFWRCLRNFNWTNIGSVIVMIFVAFIVMMLRDVVLSISA